MSWTVLGLAAVLVVWSLLARHMQRWRITPVMALVFAGALIGYATNDALAEGIQAHVVEPITGMVLAIVLFEHATNIHGGFFGGESRLALRLLFIAMPIGLALTVGLGLWLLPGLSWPTLLLVACVVVPIDFAPVASFLHDERIPLRVRHLFNLEEGYSDGVMAPVFLFALAVATGTHGHAEGVVHALAEGVPHLVVAAVVGVVIGAVVAWGANIADRRHAMTDQSRRLLVVGAPVLTYTVSVGLQANGFVAAFVCGIAFNGVRRYVDADREQELLDDIAFLLAGIVWFVFGSVAWFVLEDGVSLNLVLYSVLVLTVVRAISIGVTMLRSPLNRSERTLLAGLGPRGTASIVLALLAYIVLPDGPDQTLLTVAILVIIGSIVLHGVLGPWLVGRNAEDRAVAQRQ